MPKTHAADTAKIAYRIKPPSVWRAIRAEWEAGAIPIDLARKFDVSASSVQARRDREGWSRDGMLERMIGAGGASPFRPAPGAASAAAATTATSALGAPPPFSVGMEGVDAVLVHEIALRAAIEALARGRAAEAIEIVHAGDVVGCFACVVAEMRADWAEQAADRARSGSEAGHETSTDGAATADGPPPSGLP